VRERGPQRDDAAERVSDERRGQLGGDYVDERERLGRERRPAPAREVRRDDVEARRERLDLPVPEARVAERGMEQDDLRQSSSPAGSVVPRMSSSSSCRSVCESSSSSSLGSGFSMISSLGSLDNWRFCPRCAGKLTRAGDHLACGGCGARFWANSVPGAQAVVARGGRVLLGRRRDDPSAGLWDLPGGFLHEGEDALAALRREVREETGLEIEPTAFLGTWNEAYWERTVLCLTWLARVVGGEERAGDDLVELRWFDAQTRPRGHELAFPSFDEILSLWAARQEHA